MAGVNCGRRARVTELADNFGYPVDTVGSAGILYQRAQGSDGWTHMLCGRESKARYAAMSIKASFSIRRLLAVSTARMPASSFPRFS